MRKLLFLPILLVACSDDESGVTWQGEAPHADVSGAADGHDITVELAGEAAAAVTCKLKYTVPDAADPATWNRAVLGEFEVAIHVTEGGVEKAYELEFVAPDFSTMSAGTELAVPAEAAAEVSFEWEAGTTVVNYEQSASKGTLVFAELVGTPGADGKVIPAGAGRVGGAFDLELPSGGTLRGSFTAACTETEVE
jgi:hypothetical protein